MFLLHELFKTFFKIIAHCHIIKVANGMPLPLPTVWNTAKLAVLLTSIVKRCYAILSLLFESLPC